jgi:hypothetical protein
VTVGPPDTWPIELLAFVSRVRNCDESGACCRAAAAVLLGEPVPVCAECGHPCLPGDVCPCLQYIGQPPNPAAAQYHAASRRGALPTTDGRDRGGEGVEDDARLVHAPTVAVSP